MRLAPILLSIIVFLFFSCDRTKKEFEAAQKINTVQAYKQFLQKYPDSKWVEKSKEAIIEIEFFIEQEQINTTEAYEQFLQKYPIGEFAEKAKQAIGLLNAQEKNSIEAYQKFLDTKPDSKYAVIANNNLTSSLYEKAKQDINFEFDESIFYKKAVEENKIESLEIFLKRYPNSNYLSSVENKLNNLNIQLSKRIELRALEWFYTHMTLGHPYHGYESQVGLLPTEHKINNKDLLMTSPLFSSSDVSMITFVLIEMESIQNGIQYSFGQKWSIPIEDSRRIDQIEFRKGKIMLVNGDIHLKNGTQVKITDDESENYYIFENGKWKILKNI